MELPDNFKKCETEYYKDHDPYDSSDLQDCSYCNKKFHIDDLFETPFKNEMCRPCIKEGHADVECSHCEGSGEGYLGEETICPVCKGSKIKEFRI